MPVCKDCTKEFPSNFELDRHKSRKIPCTKGKHQCGGCLFNFTTKRSLDSHIREGRCKGKQPAVVTAELQRENADLKDMLQQQRSPLDLHKNSVAESSGDHIRTTEDLAFQPPHNQAGSSSSEEALQPPVDQPPTVIDKPHVFEFGNHKIRKTGETPQHISVYDFIAAVTDHDYKTACKTFLRMKQTYSEVATEFRYFKFPGSGQKDIPVTGAHGAVVIMNLLPGHKAAQFRVAYADIIVRYLGGDETLVGEIQRNRVAQETAAETNPIRLFGEAVTPSVVFHETSTLKLQSMTDIIDFRSPQVYTRQIFDKVSNVHPVGRPQEVVSADELAELSVVKVGSQGNNTGRQSTHTTNFAGSKLLDSKLTSSYTHVETQAKDIWKNNGELYEGLFEGKTAKDTELLLVRDQKDYERQLKFYHQLCPIENTSLELQLAQEKSKQVEAEADAKVRKAEIEADARKVEAQSNADARKVEAQSNAEARKAEADARKAEAEARKVELQLEMWKLRNPQISR